MCRRFGRNDIIYLTVLAVIIVLFCVCLFMFRKDGDKVIIKVNGEIYGEYLLTKEQEITISTDKAINTVTIHDNKVLMKEASCPDKICMHHRGISKDNESIVCLPNKVIVSVESGKKSEYDAIVE